MALGVKKNWYTKTELGSNANGLGASLIGIEDAGGYYSSDDVEGALQEIAGGSTDETVKVSAVDTTAGYLTAKLLAGTNVILTPSGAGDETLTISSSGGVAATNWGSIAGTLTDQLDLVAALNLKYDAADFNTDFGTQFATKDTDDLTEGTNLYFTDARARSAISTTATGLTYTSATGVLSLTAGYGISTTVKQGQWDTAYGWGNHASAGYLTDLSGQTTTDLAEGTNLYFTNARAITALTGQNVSIFTNDSGYLTSVAFADLSDYPANATGSLTNDGSGNFSWVDYSGIISFPGFTSLLADYGFTDNSANWNTAYGWGDWSGQGFITGVTWGDITGTQSIINLSGFTNDSGFITDISGFSTSDLAEGTNLYYTQARFDTAFTAKSTTDLSEGTNLYYTEARVSANTDVSANTSARHSAVTLAGKDYLTLSGQEITAGSIDLADDVTGVLPIANGGTNSSTALNNDRVMISSGGAIIESATITTAELALLNGIASVSTGAVDNDKFVTQGYVDDAIAVENLWDRTGTTVSLHNVDDYVKLDDDSYLQWDNGSGTADLELYREQTQRLRLLGQLKVTPTFTNYDSYWHGITVNPTNNITANGSYRTHGLEISPYAPIDAGITNTAQTIGVIYNSVRTTAADAGTLETQAADFLRYGHDATVNASSVTNYARGLWIKPDYCEGEIGDAIDLLLDSPNVGGTVTDSIGIQLSSRAAITANNQTRYGIVITSNMPTAGAYTGTDVQAIDLRATSGLARDGIRFGNDTNLYRSAANTLTTDDDFECASLDLNGAELSGVNIALELPNNASSTGWADMTNNVLLTHMNDNWEDSSGEENDGTATGALFTMNSKLGTHAGNFDGANDYVTIADNASLDITGELTISFWAKYTADIDANHGLVSKYLGNDGAAVNKRGFSVAQNATGGVQFVISSDGSFANSKSVSYATSLGTTWKHIVVSYDPSTYMRIYVDGTQVAENTTSIPASIYSGDMDMWIGMQFANSEVFRFPGLIDEVAIWSRLLTSTEISDIYDAQATGEKGLYVAHGVSAEGFTVRSPKIMNYKNDLISKIPKNILKEDGKLNLDGVYENAKRGNEMDIGQVLLTNSLLISELQQEIEKLKQGETDKK